jgi:esterase/lipase
LPVSEFIIVFLQSVKKYGKYSIISVQIYTMRFKWIYAILIILIILFFAGPRPATPKYNEDMPTVPAQAAALDSFIKARESQHNLKPDNEARIIWANDSLKQETEYAIVYLHGFTASQGEGDPVHRNIAREFGCNLYLSRLAEHGIDTVEDLINFTVDKYWESAKQALAIGKQLGKKVILMGTSAGGALALRLAAEYPGDVDALVLLSPCIAIKDPSAWVLNKPWGLKIAHLILHSDYIDSKDTLPAEKKYWYTHIRSESAAQLQEFLATSMNKKIFERVKQPTELLYFYKNEIQQDSTVKVSAMLDMYDELGTSASLKTKQAMPNTGSHVICSSLRSHDVEGVQEEIEKFLKGVIGMKQVP